jgi:hypothetical protein
MLLYFYPISYLRFPSRHGAKVPSTLLGMPHSDFELIVMMVEFEFECGLRRQKFKLHHWHQ